MLREELGIAIIDAEVEPHERAVARLSSSAPAETVAAGWAAGRRLTLPDAVAFALERTAGLDRPS